MRQVKNIVTNAIRLGTGKELARKALERAAGPTTKKEELEAWCQKHCSSIDDWIKAEEESLWNEAIDFASRTTKAGKEKLDNLGVALGGGGHYGLLYYLTRSRKPEIVVETGVAAGFSSLAILTAMAKNSKGKLFSSDFPYCRLPEPEKYIGILVEESLKGRWQLFIQGDRANFPRIAENLGSQKVDLFHYDSDKSVAGRKFAYEKIKPFLKPDSICVFDDIQNNWHFRDLVESEAPTWRVFEFEGKYLGMTRQGPPTA